VNGTVQGVAVGCVVIAIVLMFSVTMVLAAAIVVVAPFR